MEYFIGLTVEFGFKEVSLQAFEVPSLKANNSKLVRVFYIHILLIFGVF